MSMSQELFKADEISFKFAKERERQVKEEGWTIEHDDRSGDCGQLAKAAASYAMDPDNSDYRHDTSIANPPDDWPWATKWWKPTAQNGIDGRLRELEKAGALLIAEYQRLQRLQHKGEQQ